MLKLKELCFEITSSCLLNCVFCSTFDDEDRKVCQKHIPVNVIFKVIDEFSFLGGYILELSGGEPLLHPNLEDIVRYGLKKNLNVILYTSGILTNNDITFEKLRNLFNYGLRHIVFNCQGLFTVHDFLVGRTEAFNQLIPVIKHAKNLGYYVDIHFVPNKFNYFQIKDFYYYMQSLKVDRISILRLVKQGRATKSYPYLELGYSQYKSFFQQISLLCLSNHLPMIRIGTPFKEFFDQTRKKNHFCHAGRSSLDIMSNGNIIPCPAFKDIKEAIAGNIFGDSLKDVWFKSKFLNFLRKRKCYKNDCIAQYFYLDRKKNSLFSL